MPSGKGTHPTAWQEVENPAHYATAGSHDISRVSRVLPKRDTLSAQFFSILSKRLPKFVGQGFIIEQSISFHTKDDWNSFCSSDGRENTIRWRGVHPGGMGPMMEKEDKRQESEDAARVGDAQDLFQSLVDDAEEGVVVLEPNRVVRYANAAAEFLLGHKREELIGEMFGLPLVANDKPTRVNVVSADGRMRLVELRIDPLAASPESRLVLRLRDITVFHQDVVSAREQVRRRDDFLAMLSHELRNPLAAIHGAGLILMREEAEMRVRQGAREIFDRQFKHLMRLLDDLLDIARIARGKLEVQKERVALNQIVRDAVAAVSPQANKRGHALQVDIPAEPLWVWGDATRLGQVVVNLLNNAVKFTPEKGHLSLSVTASADEVALRICDDGPGIPKELLPRIFEPFVQGGQSLARSEGGLGLGLALADTIVRLHGGSIDAQPNEDCPGVSFTVRLPSAEASGDAPAKPTSTAVRPLRILLVEDSDDARRMLRDLLRLEGHEVLEADDGEAGLTALLEQQPDVALVDIGLPSLSGYELARRARQDQRGQKIRLIAATGYGMPQDVESARAAGFDGHLVKPLRYADLAKVLHSSEC
jgi:signal transduction histidine kinase/CheY-like chemotaxis protein